MSSKQATVHIDLDAVLHNFNYVRELAPASKIMAVIKADAYGHGAIPVARKLIDADAFGVARVSEAVKLREAGVNKPICLLEGVVDKEELNLASVYELQIVIHSDDQLALLKNAGARRSAWLKIDTGMGRLGVTPDRAAGMLERLGSQQLLGLMTHFACSDDLGSDLTGKQIEIMNTLSKQLATVNPLARQVSMANSAGILAHSESRAAWVRPGLMLYGASPMLDGRQILDLEPAMTFSAPVIAVRQVKAGQSIGYGSLWNAGADCRVAVVAGGYADGYPREVSPGTEVLLGGQRRKIVGRVSMDMVSVLLDDSDTVEPGEHVTLWGEGLPIEEVARQAGTNPYTLMCRISARVRRTCRGEVRG